MTYRKSLFFFQNKLINFTEHSPFLFPGVDNYWCYDHNQSESSKNWTSNNSCSINWKKRWSFLQKAQNSGNCSSVIFFSLHLVHWFWEEENTSNKGPEQVRGGFRQGKVNPFYLTTPSDFSSLHTDKHIHTAVTDLWN